MLKIVSCLQIFEKNLYRSMEIISNVFLFNFIFLDMYGRRNKSGK